MAAFTEAELDQAARDVFRECRKDAVPDILRLADYESDWPSIRAGLLTRLAANTFHPQAPEIVEMPKSELASRPIAILKVEDRIVYQTVMNRMALAIDTELTEEVFSARSQSTKRGKVHRPDQGRAWLAFQKQGKELCTRYSEACMVTTDITSYYEFVSIARLIEELHRVPGVGADDVNLLRRLLEGWNKGPLNGLPQGAGVSAILGNFYLKPLDAILRKLPVKFVRFQDDIKIFAESAPVLRRAVAELTPVIRRRHLNLSSAKTELVEGPDVLDHFEDSRKDGINYKIEVDDETARHDLEALFDEAVSNKINARDAKFSVYRLQKMESDHAVPWILDNLDQAPFLADLLVGYLGSQMEAHPEIEARVIAFLNDADRNLFPFVEMHLIRLLASLSIVSDDGYHCLWQMLMDPSKESRTRQFAARAIGRHLPKHERADIDVLKGLLDKVGTDTDLQRAILGALREAGDAEKTFLNDVSLSVPALQRICKYLATDRTLPKT